MKIKEPTKVSEKFSKDESMPVENSRRHPTSMPTSLAANPIGMSEERKALYAELNKANEELPPTQESEEDTSSGLENPDTPPEEGATETPPVEGEPTEEEVHSEEGDTQQEKHTMVPHAALHKEREEHKETKGKIKELVTATQQLQRQLQVLMDENARLRGTDPKPEAIEKDPTLDIDGPIDDIEGTIRSLAKEIKAVKAENSRFKEERLEELYTQKSRKMDEAVKLVENELIEEGYPGFSMFRAQVASKIEELGEGDKTKLAALDNPAGWQDVYKKHVYPEYAKLFGVKAKETKQAEKEELKGRANLVGSSGKAPVKPEEKPAKPWGLGDYFNMRMDRRPT